MTQVHRFALTTVMWAIAWTGMLLGTAYGSVSLLVWGVFVAMAGVVTMVWFIVEYAMAKITDQLTEDLGERDRRRTTEMAEAMVRAGTGELRIVD